MVLAIGDRGGKMNTKTSRLVLIFASLNFALVPFQNCSAPINSELASTASSAVTGVSVPVEISFKDTANLYNIKNMTQSFSLNAEAESSIQSIQCQLDSNIAVDCSSKGISLTALADGDHTLKVIVLQKDNQKSEAIKTFRVDTTVPVVTVSQKPAAITNLNSANFVFSSTDSLSGVLSTECSLNNAAFSICNSPHLLNNLAQGAQSLRIRTTDRAGNSSQIFSHSWSVDSGAPSVQLTAMPAAITPSTSASFQFSGVGIVSYECSLDNAAYAACVSPKAYSALAAGSRSFKVRGANAAGIKSADVSFSWTVDNAAPTAAQMTSGFASIGLNKSGQISFSSTDSLSGIKEYQCSFNNAAYAVCTSPRVLTAVEGVNLFKVKAFDLAGNVSAESTSSFTVDSIKPTLSFTQTPGSSTTSTSAQFVFTSADINGSGIASTQCSLDNATFANCTSPKDITSLSVAAHKFSVQVKDRAGNTTTVEHSWAVNAVVVPPPSEPPASNMKKVFFATGHMGRTLISCDGGSTWIKDRSDNNTNYCASNDCDHTPYASVGADSNGGYLYTNNGWGVNGTLKRSRDGVNWTTIDSGSWGGGVAAGSNKIVHVKEGGTWTQSSVSNISWSKINDVVTTQISYPGVFRVGGKIFVSGRGPLLALSTDEGASWSNLPNAMSGSTNRRKFAEGNGIVVATSFAHRQNLPTLGYVSRSTDQGQTWTSIELGSEITNLVFNGTHFMFISNGLVYKSTDGVSWTNTKMMINGSVAPEWWIGTVSYNPDTKTYAAINGGWATNYSSQYALKSTDGINWTKLVSPAFIGGHDIISMMTAEIESLYCQ